MIFHNIPIAIAAGIVFGAIASATDPASTIDVLWEYRSLGILTTSLTAIVALDDALAMALYGLGTAAAEILTGNSGSITGELGRVSLNLAGAVVLGAAFAFILMGLLRWFHQPERGLAFAVGLILLLITFAVYLDMDVILTTMTLGFVLTNMIPRRSKNLFKIMRSFSVPIYVIFFVLAGARLGISQMPGWLWIIVIIYVIARSAGKIVGAYIGAKYSDTKPVVRKYLGMGLFAQGGIAIGLSIMASHHLSGIMIDENLALGDVIISGVAATTLIVQLLGPAMVKLAIKLSGEIGRNVTDDDVINSWTVANVMDKDVILIREDEPLINAAKIFTENDYLVYPVVDKENNIRGVLSLESLKDVLDDQHSWNWLVASDVMRPAADKAFPSSRLRDVLDQMSELKIDQMPVMETNGGNVPIGILDIARVKRQIEKEVLRRQEQTA
jgi:CBS domain-containing protein